jgi:hypothetical protein
MQLFLAIADLERTIALNTEALAECTDPHRKAALEAVIAMRKERLERYQNERRSGSRGPLSTMGDR